MNQPTFLFALNFIMAAPPRCIADADIIVLSCGFLFFFSLPNLSRRRLDVYHTFTYDVALVRI